MATTKRVSGDYNISSVDASTDNVVITTHTVTVNGNLTVTGTTTSVETTNTEIADAVITLNKGEPGSGVTGTYSGIEVDRGSANDVAIRWNETSDIWELTTDGVTYTEITTSSGAGISDIVADTTPQLGGDLDLNGHSITTARSNESIVLAPNGSGELHLDTNAVRILNNPGTPSAESGYNKLWAKTPASGDTGLFYTNSTSTDELASAKRARLYGLIF